MLCALFASAIVACVPAAGAAQPASTELVARVAPTHFVAVNPSETAEVLVFRGARRAVLAIAVLPAHAVLDERFAAGTLDGLTLEVLSRGAQLARTSGELSLREITAGRFDALWIEASASPERAGHLHTWGERADQFETIAPLASASGRAPDRDDCVVPDPSAPLSAHAPAITPSDKPKGDLPPRLEKKPLPPV